MRGNKEKLRNEQERVTDWGESRSRHYRNDELLGRLEGARSFPVSQSYPKWGR